MNRTEKLPDTTGRFEMGRLKMLIKLSIALGIASLIALFFSHLALTDIYHSEPNPQLEWNILRISAIILITFTGVAIYTFYRVLKNHQVRR
jgi:uncharacterized BrkB/YihY/UPF0761 family membrane protein